MRKFENQAGLGAHVAGLNLHMKTLRPTANQALHNRHFSAPILSIDSITFTLG
jgi:hypothetical protein